MKTFRLIISSPNGSIFDSQAFMLTLRGTAGDLAILAGHIPFTTTVKSGTVKIELPDETEKFGETDGGLLTVSPDGIATLLSGSFKWIE